ncbi:MAG: aliphatic sulfonate ABC transporter substrate-binding protein [Myxococcota bacterium]
MLTLPPNRSASSAIRARAFVFEDPASLRLHQRLERIAPSDMPVLITGETGTGKEIVARRLHALSRRAEKPFVAINVGAFSESLIESELFGYEKGAFTGALAAKEGFFEAADGGTLFLDEIGELALPLQVKLLRVLQEGQVTRIGSRAPLHVDVRLVAATNVDLLAAMRAKHFREDLYYRLRVSALSLPPLRERPADILPLARHFLEIYQRKLGRFGMKLTAGASACLLEHSWPGNIRELENTIHHALVVCAGDELTRSDLEIGTPLLSNAEREPKIEPRLERQLVLGVDAPARCAVESDENELEGLRRVVSRLIQQRTSDLFAKVERTLYTEAYRAARENQLETARILGVSRNVVRARLIEQGTLHGPLRRSEPVRRRAAVSVAERTLRIGYQKLGLFMLLRHSGGLERALATRGVRVEWHEFQGGFQLVAALKREELDMAGLGNWPAVMAQAERVPIVYVAAEPPAPHAAALVVPASSKIEHVADLKGRRVVVNRAAQAHYVLMRALEEASIDARDVEVCFEPPERAWLAFEAGEVDAWAIWDPFLSSARLELGARVLRDANGLATNATYYVARRGLARESPEVLHEVTHQLRLVARFARSQPERAAAVLAPAFGFSPRALLASWQRELEPVPVNAQLLAAQQDIADALHRFALIREPVRVAEAAWEVKLAG